MRIFFNLYFGATEEKFHESYAKEIFFNVLVDLIKESIDESKIECKLNYFYQRLDTQDFVVAGRVGDVEDNYQLLADLGMNSLLLIYSIAKGKDFDQVFQERGLSSFFAHKVFAQLEILEILSLTTLRMTK